MENFLRNLHQANLRPRGKRITNALDAILERFT